MAIYHPQRFPRTYLNQRHDGDLSSAPSLPNSKPEPIAARGVLGRRWPTVVAKYTRQHLFSRHRDIWGQHSEESTNRNRRRLGRVQDLRT